MIGDTKAWSTLLENISKDIDRQNAILEELVREVKKIGKDRDSPEG